MQVQGAIGRVPIFGPNISLIEAPATYISVILQSPDSIPSLCRLSLVPDFWNRLDIEGIDCLTKFPSITSLTITVPSILRRAQSLLNTHKLFPYLYSILTNCFHLWNSL